MDPNAIRINETIRKSNKYHSDKVLELFEEFERLGLIPNSKKNKN
jgi:hypothetical protein